MIKYILLLLLSSNLFANNDHENHHIDHDHHDDEHNDHIEDKFGSSKAITKVHSDWGFQLSNEAFKTLKLQIIKTNKKIIEIEKSSLVATNDLKGIYRYHNGYFKLIPVKIIKTTKDSYMIEIQKKVTEYAIGNIGLLRVADIFSNDESEYGHSH